MIRRGLVIAAATTALVAPSMPAQAGYACPPGNFEDRPTSRVEMSGDCFRPAVARVEVGEELTFVNLDSHDHTVGGVAGIFGDGHDSIFAGQSVTFRFDEEGVYPFFCLVHPGMAGAVVVGDGTASGDTNAAAAPVEPASASSTVEATSAFPTTIAVGAGVLVLLGTATLLARRRRAIGRAA